MWTESFFTSYIGLKRFSGSLYNDLILVGDLKSMIYTTREAKTPNKICIYYPLMFPVGKIQDFETLVKEFYTRSPNRTEVLFEDAKTPLYEVYPGKDNSLVYTTNKSKVRTIKNNTPKELGLYRLSTDDLVVCHEGNLRYIPAAQKSAILVTKLFAEVFNKHNKTCKGDFGLEAYIASVEGIYSTIFENKILPVVDKAYTESQELLTEEFFSLLHDIEAFVQINQELFKDLYGPTSKEKTVTKPVSEKSGGKNYLVVQFSEYVIGEYSKEPNVVIIGLDAVRDQDLKSVNYITDLRVEDGKIIAYIKKGSGMEKSYELQDLLSTFYAISVDEILEEGD